MSAEAQASPARADRNEGTSVMRKAHQNSNARDSWSAGSGIGKFATAIPKRRWGGLAGAAATQSRMSRAAATGIEE